MFLDILWYVVELHKVSEQRCCYELQDEAVTHSREKDTVSRACTYERYGHTPCNTEFIKQVFPWLMSPGGR